MRSLKTNTAGKQAAAQRDRATAETKPIMLASEKPAPGPGMLSALRSLNASLDGFMDDRAVEKAILALDQADGGTRWGDLCAMLDDSAAAIDKATP